MVAACDVGFRNHGTVEILGGGGTGWGREMGLFRAFSECCLYIIKKDKRIHDTVFVTFLFFFFGVGAWVGR